LCHPELVEGRFSDMYLIFLPHGYSIFLVSQPQLYFNRKGQEENPEDRKALRIFANSLAFFAVRSCSIKFER